MAISNISANFPSLPPSLQKELEAWVVNSVKVKMIKKLDNLLETEGKVNARKLFLTPVFTILELVKKVENDAPEIKTYFFKQLSETLNEAEKRLI
jgi:uncharacterized protein YicC (UPF0701 family)